MTRVLILGNNGMLGHMTERVFQSDGNAQVLTTSRSGSQATYPFDVLVDDIYELLRKASPNYIVNCIGTIKPRIDEKSVNSTQDAIFINSLFPQRLARATQEFESKVIQIATDCVFSGSKGSYTEGEPHDALDVYGKTKSLGESSAGNFLNLRVSIIGPEKGRSSSLLEWFLNQPQGAKLRGFANHYWNGVSTFHFAKVALGIIQNSAFISGKAHLVPDDRVSKYELLQEFKKTYQMHKLEIEEDYPEQIIDRTLATENSNRNLIFWRNAGYSKVPQIHQIVAEMKEFSQSRP